MLVLSFSRWLYFYHSFNIIWECFNTFYTSNSVFAVRTSIVLLIVCIHLASPTFPIHRMFTTSNTLWPLCRSLLYIFPHNMFQCRLITMNLVVHSCFACKPCIILQFNFRPKVPYQIECIYRLSSLTQLGNIKFSTCNRFYYEIQCDIAYYVAYISWWVMWNFWMFTMLHIFYYFWRFNFW